MHGQLVLVEGVTGFRDGTTELTGDTRVILNMVGLNMPLNVGLEFRRFATSCADPGTIAIRASLQQGFYPSFQLALQL